MIFPGREWNKVRGSKVCVRVEQVLGALRAGPLRGHQVPVHPPPPASDRHDLPPGLLQQPLPPVRPLRLQPQAAAQHDLPWSGVL